MIAANELRIGNWLLELGWDEDAGGNIVADTEGNAFVNIDINFFQYIANSSSNITQYEGIPLTPEILEKAGFKKDNIDELDGYSSEGRLSIFLQAIQCEDGRTDWYTYIQFNVGMPHQHLVTNPPEYLHELQNLYRCLVGKELSIDLT